MNVLALTRYGLLGPSTRVRFGQFIPALAERGIDVHLEPLLGNAHVRRLYAGHPRRRVAIVAAYARRVWSIVSDRSPDVVWIEKELLPYVPAWAEQRLLAGRPYVLDLDDAVFHTYDRHPRRAVRRLLGDKIDRLMRGAALVTAGNAYLANRAAAAGAPRVEIVPSVVDVVGYGPVVPEPAGPFTVGWVGSPGSERQLDAFRGVFDHLLADADTRLVLVGASDRVLEGLRHETWPWSESTEVQAMQAFHVGIMPLEDGAWERGKCGFKLVQYMSAGRAVVASPVGVNATLVQDGVTGVLATSPDSWTGALARLQDDPGLRARMGAAGRARAEAEYSLAAIAPRLADLLASVVQP